MGTSTRLAQIPDDLLNDPLLNDSIAHLLPSAYNFEIHKTIHHLRHFHAKRVALQMPEGLTMFATAIADIVARYTDAEPVIMGDVTYGACCIDDYTARALGCDFLVHYAHSCLVPLDQTGGLRTLYVFVEIALDVEHLVRTIRYNFPSDSDAFQSLVSQTDPAKAAASKSKAQIDIAIEDEASRDGHVSQTKQTRKKRRTHLALVGTVQFINALAPLKDALESELNQDAPLLTTAAAALARKQITAGPADDSSAVNEQNASMSSYDRGAYRLTIPQIRPLSPGEILGCTSPTLPTVITSDQTQSEAAPVDAIDALLYLGDGRFHLESAMIANPHISAYFRFDPYSRKFEREGYDHARMRIGRAQAVGQARKSLQRARVPVPVASASASGPAATPKHEGRREEAWGLVLGTLGRQGSTKVLAHLRTLLNTSNTTENRQQQQHQHPHVPILLSELSPAKLALFNDHLVAFVQTSCPRLSIDWGSAFDRPLLSPYEAALAIGAPNTKNVKVAGSLRSVTGKVEDDDGLAGWERAALHARDDPAKLTHDATGENGYPMDFYADDSLGPWTPRHGMGRRSAAAALSADAAAGKGSKRSGAGAGGGGGATAVLKELRRKRAEREAAKAQAASSSDAAKGSSEAVQN
ncbi:hypothetical protein V8E36_007228 [Tilletia maclaganii]